MVDGSTKIASAISRSTKTIITRKEQDDRLVRDPQRSILGAYPSSASDGSSLESQQRAALTLIRTWSPLDHVLLFPYRALFPSESEALWFLGCLFEDALVIWPGRESPRSRRRGEKRRQKIRVIITSTLKIVDNSRRLEMEIGLSI